VPEYYVISTAHRENFALSSSGLCAQPDFGIASQVSYGFFYLNKNPTAFRISRSDITTGDSFRYAIHSTPKRPPLTEVSPKEHSIVTRNHFSEWSFKAGNAVENRSLVLLAREAENGTSAFPAIRASFTSSSHLTVLFEGKMARPGRVPDDPCKKVVHAIGRRRRVSKKSKAGPIGTVENITVKEGATEVEDDTKSQDGGIAFIGLGTLILFGFVVWRWRRKPNRSRADMNGLLDRTGDVLENEGF
jgi:hypothetical protein